MARTIPGWKLITKEEAFCRGSEGKILASQLVDGEWYITGEGTGSLQKLVDSIKKRDGFRVYLDEYEDEDGYDHGRYLTDEEITETGLYMRYDGALIRVEVYVDKEGEAVRYPRFPRDLTLIPGGNNE